MAAGVRERMKADIGVSITGIAGPGGGSPEKPVGLVWVAVDYADGRARRLHVPGDRNEIRQRAAQAALEMVRRTLASS
jgi:nicotinamide-nucleotide amidase